MTAVRWSVLLVTLIPAETAEPGYLAIPRSGGGESAAHRFEFADFFLPIRRYYLLSANGINDAGRDRRDRCRPTDRRNACVFGYRTSAVPAHRQCAVVPLVVGACQQKVTARFVGFTLRKTLTTQLERADISRLMSPDHESPFCNGGCDGFEDRRTRPAFERYSAFTVYPKFDR